MYYECNTTRTNTHTGEMVLVVENEVKRVVSRSLALSRALFVAGF